MRTEADDIRCFVKHNDMKCLHCQHGLRAWMRRRFGR